MLRPGRSALSTVARWRPRWGIWVLRFKDTGAPLIGRVEYVKHTGSGIFAVPPGVRVLGDWFGKDLFE